MMVPRTELLDRAFARVRTLPPDTQDEYARALMSLAAAEPVALSQEERAAIA